MNTSEMQTEIQRLRALCEAQQDMIGEAYQVLAQVLVRADLFDHPEAQRCLDYFSRGVFDPAFLPLNFDSP
jgi:hypothetical protein